MLHTECSERTIVPPNQLTCVTEEAALGGHANLTLELERECHHSDDSTRRGSADRTQHTLSEDRYSHVVNVLTLLLEAAEFEIR